MQLPDKGLRAMAEELLARRALDTIDAQHDRARRRASAICDCLRANFRLTGNPRHIWKLDTVAEVILDDLQASGWPDLRARHVHDTLNHITRDPMIPLSLVFEDGKIVLRGITAQGAAT